MKKKRGLNRGLEALLGDASAFRADWDKQETVLPGKQNELLQQIPIERLKPSRLQPRQSFDDEELDMLAASIRQHGIIQPLVARKRDNEEGVFEIVAGERRWRAAQRAGQKVVPVLVQDLADQDVAAVALIENMQRRDLNPMERAHGFQRLIDEFSLSHAQAAESVGISRAAVSNLLRLLTLDTQVQQDIAAGRLDMGHARALISLSVDKQRQLAQHIIEKQLSVREAERLVRQENTGKQKPRRQATVDADVQLLITELAQTLQTHVAIKQQDNGSGKIVIQYSNLDQLDGLLSKICR